MKRIERIRLYPNAHQEQALRFMLDVTRELYNAALQERRDAYRLRRMSVSAKMQYAELTALRKPATWLDERLAAVYRECEDAVLRRLDLAMQAFFRRCKRGEAPGFPRFKPAVRWHQLTFPHGDRALKFDAVQSKVTIPGVGSVRLRNMTRSAKGTAEVPGRNVAAKAALNRVVLDAGFGLLEQMIVAKAEEAGRRIVRVDPRFSSQECSRCGTIASESRRKRRFRCVACGFTCHADVNAALVIRRRGQSALMSELIPAEDAGGRARCAA